MGLRAPLSELPKASLESSLLKGVRKVAQDPQLGRCLAGLQLKSAAKLLNARPILVKQLPTRHSLHPYCGTDADLGIRPKSTPRSDAVTFTTLPSPLSPLLLCGRRKLSLVPHLPARRRAI